MRWVGECDDGDWVVDRCVNFPVDDFIEVILFERFAMPDFSWHFTIFPQGHINVIDASLFLVGTLHEGQSRYGMHHKPFIPSQPVQCT